MQLLTSTVLILVLIHPSIHPWVWWILPLAQRSKCPKQSFHISGTRLTAVTLSRTHRAPAWRSDSCRCSAHRLRLYPNIHAKYTGAFFPSQFSIPLSTLITTHVNNSNAPILYHIIMHYISSYRRLYLYKGHAPLFEVHTRIHAATRFPHLWFHSFCPSRSHLRCPFVFFCFSLFHTYSFFCMGFLFLCSSGLQKVGVATARWLFIF